MSSKVNIEARLHPSTFAPSLIRLFARHSSPFVGERRSSHFHLSSSLTNDCQRAQWTNFCSSTRLNYLRSGLPSTEISWWNTCSLWCVKLPFLIIIFLRPRPFALVLGTLPRVLVFLRFTRDLFYFFRKNCWLTADRACFSPEIKEGSKTRWLFGYLMT